MWRMIRGITLGVLLTGVVAGGIAFFILRQHKGADDWVVRQIVKIVNTYIVPDIDFDSFELRSTTEVVLKGVTLTAPDGTRVVSAGTLEVMLTERPRLGSPITIERVTLTDSFLHLIEEEDGSGFRGLVPFVKTQNVKNQESLDEDVRLNRALELRQIVLRNGGLIYDPLGEDPEMRLDGIALDLEIAEASGEGESHWYRIDTHIDRAPLIELELLGRFKLDGLMLELESLKLASELNAGEYSAFPPSIQQTFASHDMQGTIQASISGLLNLREFIDSDMRGTIDLTAFNFAWGDYRIPIEQADFDFHMGGRRAYLDLATIRGLKAVVELSGVVADLRDEEAIIEGSWTITELELRRLMRAASNGDTPPKFAGIFQSTGTAKIRVYAGRVTPISGEGAFQVQEGRLVNLPVISALEKSIASLGGLRRDPNERKDRLEAKFTLDSSAVKFTEIQAATPLMAARGDLTRAYDRTLSGTVNAGPLEKMQNLLGPIGDLMGAITDRLVTYGISGTTQEPKVSVQPLGIGSNSKK